METGTYVNIFSETKRHRANTTKINNLLIDFSPIRGVVLIGKVSMLAGEAKAANMASVVPD